MIRFIVACKQIYDKYAEDEMTVYAAQVSFFIILSFIPSVMLLMTAVQMIPAISDAQFLELVVDLTPREYKSLAFRIISDLSLKSPATMLSVTAATVLWTSGRGMFSVARGLNRIHGQGEKRLYLVSRLISCGYTVVFVAVCVLSLGLLVFGRMIQNLLEQWLPWATAPVSHLVDFRALWFLLVLVIFFLGIYTFVPDRKLALKDQLPGALFSAVGWLVFSLGFSLYFNQIGGKNYSYMYGSLAGIVLLLLWLYICMCILFFGAEINYYRSRLRAHQSLHYSNSEEKP